MKINFTFLMIVFIETSNPTITAKTTMAYPKRQTYDRGKSYHPFTLANIARMIGLIEKLEEWQIYTTSVDAAIVLITTLFFIFVKAKIRKNATDEISLNNS